MNMREDICAYFYLSVRLRLWCVTECVHAFCICIYRCSHFFFFWLWMPADTHLMKCSLRSQFCTHIFREEIYLLFGKIIGCPCYVRNTKHITGKHLLIDSYQTRWEIIIITVTNFRGFTHWTVWRSLYSRKHLKSLWNFPIRTFLNWNSDLFYDTFLREIIEQLLNLRRSYG